MAMKKVLAGIGIICVVGPVAVAAINVRGGDSNGNAVDQIGEARPDAGDPTIFSALQKIIQGKTEGRTGGGAEAPSPGAAGSEKAAIPFRKLPRSTEILMPDPAELARQMGLRGAGPFADLGAGDAGDGPLFAGGMATASDWLGTSRRAHSTGGSSGRSISAGGVNAAADRGSGGAPGSARAIGPRGANGSGNAAGDANNLGGSGPDDAAAASVLPGDGPDAGADAYFADDLGRSVALSVVAVEPPLVVAPLPSSVWMLLGACIGLGVLGYRRRHAF